METVASAKPPIFILGSPRSGTKMFRELLNSAPHIWIPQVESVFIPYFTKRINQYGDLDKWMNFKRLAADIERTKAFLELEEMGIHVDSKQWYNTCRSYKWTDVLEGFYKCVFKADQRDNKLEWNSIIWGDKTPDYLTEIPILSILFPESRFIHIVRDPRDVCLSAKKVWNKHPLRTVQLWADEVRKGISDGRTLGPKRYYELRYEDLLEDTKNELEGVFHFLGIPLPENAGQLSRTPEHYGAAKCKQYVLKNNKDKWKKQLSHKYQRRIEQIVGTMLDEFGYERHYPTTKPRRLSPLQMNLYRYMDIWHMIWFRKKERGSWLEVFKFLFSH